MMTMSAESNALVLNPHHTSLFTILIMSLWLHTVSRTLLRPVLATWTEQAASTSSSYSYLMALRWKGGPKTCSGVKKRFRLRGSGSIKRYASKCVVSADWCEKVSNFHIRFSFIS